MDHATASRFALRFGKYKSKTLKEIAADKGGRNNNDGIDYLEWVIKQDWPHPLVREAIEAFLGDGNHEEEEIEY